MCLAHCNNLVMSCSLLGCSCIRVAQARPLGCRSLLTRMRCRVPDACRRFCERAVAENAHVPPAPAHVMLAASFYYLGLVLPVRPLCAPAALRVAYPPRATAPEPLGVGQPVPPSVLQKLGVSGGRAVVCFILEDRGFACGKQLRTLSERADSFAARGCQVVAVRPPSGESRRPHHI